MGKYTVYGGEIDDFIERDYLQKIVSSFLKDVEEMNNKLISVILFGGFGKGEGSVQLINNKLFPYNDFDFYIITEEKISDKELNRISMNASKEIGMGGLEIAFFPEQEYDSRKFFHIDVRCIPYNRLSKLMKTQRYYELKYGSRVIYGDKAVLHEIKEINPEEIPLSEGLRNLFNKLHTMLLGLRKEYNEDQRKIKIFWSFKVYLSCCEALLILSGKFKPTSLERSKLFSEIYKISFPELYELIPNLHKKVNIATNFKLKPYFNVNHEKLWNTALNDLLTVFESYIKKMTKSDNIEYSINKKLPYFYFSPYLKHISGANIFPVQYLLNLGYFNILRKNEGVYFKPLFNWKDVGLRMILPVYYLLKAYQEIKQENTQEISKHQVNQTINHKLNKEIIRANLNSHNLKSINSVNSNNSDNKNLIINPGYVDKAYNELKKFIKLDKNEFWYLRDRALKSFGLYYQQRLL